MKDLKYEIITTHQSNTKGEKKNKGLKANLGPLSPRNKGLPNVPHAEHRRRLDVIPVFLCERIDAASKRPKTSEIQQKQKKTNTKALESDRWDLCVRLLLASLLPLRNTLILPAKSSTARSETKNTISETGAKTSKHQRRSSNGGELTRPPLLELLGRCSGLYCLGFRREGGEAKKP